MTIATREFTVILRQPHAYQRAIKDSPAKRKIIRAGRRSGKTVIAAEICVEKFLAGLRPLYATPTSDQLDTWWYEVKRALGNLVDDGIFRKNETEHSIERIGTTNCLRGRTAWNADMLRGSYSDFLVLDEFQLMDENTWELVGAPMLLDSDGGAMLIYTPPSLHSRSVSKARDPRHAAKLFAKAQADHSGRWATFSFTSHDNPHISAEALTDIVQDMSRLAYRQEILAEDVDEAPGALWPRALLEATRVAKAPAGMVRVVVGVDPPGGVVECGIIVAGKAEGQIYILADYSCKSSPQGWAEAVLSAAEGHQADTIVGEANYGGDLVKSTIMTAAQGRPIRYKPVQATRGKAVRAEPIVALFEQGRAHLVGSFPYLEDELTMWVPGESGRSPNRLDAMVWACTELLPSGGGNVRFL